MTRTSRPLPEIKADAIVALRALATASPDDELLPLRRAVARHLVEARAHFVDKRGEVDWSGRTGAYHAFSGQLFAEAGIPRENVPSYQSTLRYHVGNTIRQFATDDELVAAGFRQTRSPRERAADYRTERRDLFGHLESGGPLEGEEILRALELCSMTFSRIARAAIDELPSADRRAVKMRLLAVAGEAEALTG